MVRATLADGREFTFRPSFGRVASLGTPQEIVGIYAGLHGPDAPTEAAYVLTALCEQDDATPLIGWRDDTGADPGAMPAWEQVAIARHLMRHGIAGKARSDAESTNAGQFSDRFDAAEYVSAARVHLGLSSRDAEDLTMTEFQTMIAMKFPQAGDKKRSVPSRAEYDALMVRIKGAAK